MSGDAASQEMMSQNQAQYIEILANRTGVGRRWRTPAEGRPGRGAAGDGD